ncbi:MAG TPA: glycoside hydrolase family 57 [Candidatus Krumholzibacteria bacterium]|nr:glycoside hydrolase family 57 [Candidatus Krumholzibacteria bacterium]
MNAPRASQSGTSTPSPATRPGVCHALGLHMHQPPGNLRLLIESNEFEAMQIVRCYERAARYAHWFPDVARLHVGFSGILLEQMRDPDIVDRYRHIVDLPAVLASYRDAPNIEPIGMGYYHPIFPLIPPADWDDQLSSGRQIIAEVFGREPRGFWPPEMAFDMAMVPAVARAGYEYIVVDGVHVRDGHGQPVDPYRPYRAGALTVIPRDRNVSNAQESGMDAAWFDGEVMRIVAGRTEPALVTTWSDGENGGWFRQTAEEAGFFGHYFAPFMQRVKSGATPIRPVLISDYLRTHAPAADVHVKTGAWNVAQTSGDDFSQWAGSPAQRGAIEEVAGLSRRYRTLERAGVAATARDDLAAAHHLLLEAETSCYLFWGDAWIPRLHEKTAQIDGLLARVEHAATGGRSLS